MKGRLGRPRLPLRQKVLPLLAKQRCFRSCRAKRNKMSFEGFPAVFLRRRRLSGFFFQHLFHCYFHRSWH